MRRGNGRGSITKIKGRSAPWRALATTGWENGKQKRRLVGYFKTKKEAEEALDKATKYGSRAVSDAYNATVEEIYTAYMEFREKSATKDKPFTHKNIESYENGYRRLSGLKKRSLRSLTINDLQTLMATISDGSYSRSTVSNTRMVLRQLYKYAIPRGAADQNLMDYVMMNLPKMGTTDRFSSSELRALWANMGNETVDITLAMIYTATRPSELLWLQIERTNLSEHYAIGGIKTEAGIDRIIPIHKAIIPIFKRFIGNRESGFVFQYQGRAISLNYFREKLFKRMLDDLGFRKSLTPRSCRKTGISLMAENKNIPESIRIKIAGHADAAVEEKYYIEMESKKLTEAIDSLPVF